MHAYIHYLTLPYTTLHYVTCFTCITRITCITYIPTYRHTDRQNRTEHYYVVITLIKPKIHTHLLYITLHCITLHYISIIRNNTRNTYKTYIHTYIHTNIHTQTDAHIHIQIQYTTLQYITKQNNTIHTIHDITVHYSTSHHTLQYITSHTYISLDERYTLYIIDTFLNHMYSWAFAACAQRDLRWRTSLASPRSHPWSTIRLVSWRCLPPTLDQKRLQDISGHFVMTRLLASATNP